MNLRFLTLDSLLTASTLAADAPKLPSIPRKARKADGETGSGCKILGKRGQGAKF